MVKEYEKVDHSMLLETLTRGIEELTTSEKWTKYLEVQARFTHYSAGNCQLIAMQNPYATRVAGFHTWRAQNRTVKKGEKGIFILAPLVTKTENIETGENGYEIKGFRYVAVFDVAQTDGEDLPEISTKLNAGDPDGVFTRLAGVAREHGFSVIDHSFEGSSTNGDCSHADKLIRVEVANSPAQRAKTLAHEISHAILHNPETSPALERHVKELEAESAAFVICRTLGIESDAYSFGYVAGWAGGGEAAIKAIKLSQERIHRATALVLKAFENAPALVVAQ